METTSGIGKPAKSPTAQREENFRRFLGDMQAMFPKFKHDQHPQIKNVNDIELEKLTLGQRVADAVASGMGSWGFIIIQTSLLVLWITLNSVAWIKHWDGYPYILLNLALSFQAGYAAPFIMMSQNRQAAKDRLTAENDYKTDVKGEEEICHIMEHLSHQDALTLEIVQRLESQSQRIEQQGELILQLMQKVGEQQQFMKQQHQEMLQSLHTQE